MEPQAFERVKVAICIPTGGLIRAACAFSLGQIIGYLAQSRLWTEAKEQGLTLIMREGSGIAANRQKMVEEAISPDVDATHVFFIDDDMEVPPAAFASLARRRLPIVGCNYRTKFPPAHFTAVHLERSRGRMETNGASVGLEPVDYMGFGACLIETRVFKALPKPWFLGQYLDDVYTTEDLPFYWAARERLGVVAYVDQDASKEIAHVGIHKYVWSDPFPVSDPPPPMEGKPKCAAVPTVSSSPPSPGGDGGTTAPSSA